MFGYQMIGTVAVPRVDHGDTYEQAKLLAQHLYPQGFDYIVLLRVDDQNDGIGLATANVLYVFEVWKEVIVNG